MVGSEAEGPKWTDRAGRCGQRGEMLPLLKRHEVQVLRRAGLTIAKVSTLAGVSRRSIQRIEIEDEVADAEEHGERARRAIGRPSKAEPFRAFVACVLEREPELLSLEILRRAKLE